MTNSKNEVLKNQLLTELEEVKYLYKTTHLKEYADRYIEIATKLGSLGVKPEHIPII